MDIIVKGTITKVLPMMEGVSQKTGTPWQRQSFLLEHENGQYPKSIVFDVNGIDRINNFGLTEGKYVTVHLAVNAREYPQGSGKYFNSIEAWKVDGAQQGQRQAPANPGQPAPAQPAAPVQQQPQGAAPFPPQGQGGNKDDLPFD